MLTDETTATLERFNESGVPCEMYPQEGTGFVVKLLRLLGDGTTEVISQTSFQSEGEGIKWLRRRASKFYPGITI